MKSGNNSMLGKEIFLLRSASRKSALECIKKYKIRRFLRMEATMTLNELLEKGQFEEVTKDA